MSKTTILNESTFDFVETAYALFDMCETERGWNDVQGSLISAGLTVIHKLVEPTPNSWLSVLTAWSALKDDDDIVNFKNLSREKRLNVYMAYLRSCVAAYENHWYDDAMLPEAGKLIASFDEFTERGEK